MNVRTGAGTTYAKLTSDGKTVTLKSGEQVNIISSKNGWYYVSFTFNKKTVKGYVKDDYIKVTTSVVTTEPTSSVTAAATTKASSTGNTTTVTVTSEAVTYATVKSASLNVRKAAGTSGARLKYSSNKNVVLKQGKKVRLIGEQNINGVKWYKIRFTYNGEVLIGYVHGNYLNFTITSGGFTAKTISSSTVNVKSNMSGKVMTRSGKKVVLTKNTDVKVVGQTIKNNTNWYTISFKYDGSTIKGYLKASEVTLTYKITTTKEVAVTTKPAATTATATTKPAATTAAATTKPVTTTAAATTKPATTTAAATTKPTATSSSTTTDEAFKNDLVNQGFPTSYIDALMELHNEHPNWVFKAYNTGLTWSTVITKESMAGTNLIPNTKNVAWKSLLTNAYVWKEDRFVVYDSPNWVTASKAIVSYYMDPRNFLNESTVFMFESLAYDETTQTQAGVEAILKNTPMSNAYVEYTDENGQTVKKLYSEIFMEAASYSGVSPYHLASRCKQEVVVSQSAMSSSVSGTVSGYEGLYNYYNIGANNSTVTGGAIKNGLNYAKNGTSSATKNAAYMIPWDNPYKAIVGGAYFIGSSYIKVGQNTIYLQKFNVTPKNTYAHQYMGNVQAAYAEAIKVSTAYKSMDDYSELPIVFNIPVFESMPSKACSIPANTGNPNNWLKTLSVSGYSLTPTFDITKTQEYTVTVPSTVSKVTINATTVASTATVSGIGTISINKGVNVCKIIVTAENGDKKEYILNVVRKS